MNPEQTVKYWLKEYDLACKEEKDWEKDAENAIKVYSGRNYIGTDEDKRRKDTFNILWSNVETLRPSLYNSTPRPDIRRRFRDKDALGKAISETLERCATFTLDDNDFDHVMISAVMDNLLPGRGVTRVRYNPVFDETEQEVIDESVTFEQVQWDRFKHGAGKSWPEVSWVSFEHRLDKDEIEEKFPDFVDVVQYDCTEDEDNEAEGDEDKQFERCKVLEFWSKDSRKVIFIAPSYKDAPLSVDDDPLELEDFFPIPRPLMAVENSTSLVPITEYSQYETLANELEKVTVRIGYILKGLRLRGIYDSRIAEIEKLFDVGDNEFVPSENIAALIEAGGLEKAIWTLPIDSYAQTLMSLYQYRQTLIQGIYEITGISDIVRGASNPNETLGAQEIKANFGTLRLQKRQKEVQRYARDLIRLATEIISEKFSIETISAMTGLKYPTRQMQQQAQQQMMLMQQQAQLTGQPPQIPPEIQQVLNSPTWDDIKEVITSDTRREYRVDIETDSTVQAQQQEDQKNITELLGGITKFMAEAAPAVQVGVMSVDTTKALLMAAVRRFKLGREVEDALEDIEAPKDQPNPEAEAMKMQQQQEQARMQAESQKAQMEGQKEQAKLQLESQKVQAEYQGKAEDRQINKEKLALEARKIANEEAKQALEQERFLWEKEYRLRETEMKANADIQREQISAEANKVIAQINAESQKAVTDSQKVEIPEFDWKPLESAMSEIKFTIDGMRPAETSPPIINVNVEIDGKGEVKKTATVKKNDDGSFTLEGTESPGSD